MTRCDPSPVVPRRDLGCILCVNKSPDPLSGIVPFRPSRTASRQADRPSKPGMPSTGMGQFRARAIVPGHLAALKAKEPSPRAHGQHGLTFADARPEWRGR